jgi:putative sigma-54 modulation protein
MNKTSQEALQISVTGRHVSVTEPIKEYAEKKIENIGIDFPRILSAHVILDVEKHRHTAEVVFHCGNHIVIEAKAESDDLYASIDEVVTKAMRQLRKAKTKIQRHQPRELQPYEVDLHVLSPLEEDHDEHAEPEVVMTEKFAVKPMFVDEAVLQLQLSHRQFLVFLNARTEKVNVLYRRKTGNFGLIEPTLE